MASAARTADPELVTDIEIVGDTSDVHLRDCPVLTGRWPAGRAPIVEAIGDERISPVEQYEAVKPPHPSRGIPATTVTIVRCVECGGQAERTI